MKLAPLSLNDLETIRGWRNEARETLRTPFPLAEGMQTEFYRDVICRRDAPHRYWGLVGDGDDADKAEEAIIGHLLGIGGLTFIQPENGIAEISLLIDPELTGKGLGAAAVDCLLEEAFDRMRLCTVVGEVYASNSAGMEFWKKIVANHDGEWTTLPRRKWWAGRLWPSMYFTLTAEKWAPRREVSRA